jgi:phenylacetate-CoA ligase
MPQPAIHDPKAETMDREELQQLQIERLQSTLNRVCRNVAFYRAALAERGINFEQLRDLRALADLPLTTKDDLRRSYPYDMFAVPLHDIVRIHSTGGAGGNPVVVGYTRNDLRNWTDCVARLLAAAGVTLHDVVQVALDYNLSAGAFGFHQGAEQLGASVIPASLASGVEKQAVVMRDFKTTVLVTSPSHADNLAAALESLGVPGDRLNLRLGILGGERWGDGLRRQLETRLRILTTDTYGLTEVMGPGVAGECHLRQGLHINEDHFIAEIIDPTTLRPLPPGDEGELVLTTIAKEGFPLIRYRTGDVTRLIPEPCPCGRTLVRMARVTGRTDDLIQFCGQAFFPAQVERILFEAEGASPHYQIVLDRQGATDTLEIRVEVSEATPSMDEVRTLQLLRRRIAGRLKEDLDVEARVTFAEPRSLRQLPPGQGRILDRRPA